MERGFLVLDIDYRGSAGYGRRLAHGFTVTWVERISSDHIDAVNYLVKEHGVDA